MNLIEEAEDRADRLPDDSRRLYEAFREGGMSAVAALHALRYDGPIPSTDLVEELTETFRESGLSEEGARAAARGRGGRSSDLLEEAGTLGATGLSKAELEAKKKKAKEKEEATDLAKGKKEKVPVGEALGLSREDEKKITDSNAFRNRFIELFYEDGITNPYDQALTETVERNRRLQNKTGGK